MRIKMALAGALLMACLPAVGAPIIRGNTQVDSQVLDRQIANAQPKSYEDVANIIVGIYEQYGYVGVKAVVKDNVITIIEPGSTIEGDYDQSWVGQPQGQVLEVETINDSMAMADVNNRFEVLDVVVGDLKNDGSVDVSMKRSQAAKPYVANVSYSSLGQDSSHWWLQSC